MKIAITGATGLLGRNVLFEFLKQHIARLDTLVVVSIHAAQSAWMILGLSDWIRREVRDMSCSKKHRKRWKLKVEEKQ